MLGVGQQFVSPMASLFPGVNDCGAALRWTAEGGCPHVTGGGAKAGLPLFIRNHRK